MKHEALTEFCDLNMGQSPDSKTYNEQGDGMPFYQGNADFGEIHPETRVWCSKPVKVANEGDILISVRAPIGAMNIATETCCIGRGLAALTPKTNKCSQKYLYYALESKIDVLVSKGTGSTFKAISKKVLAETLVPSYNDEKQQQITDTLSKIDVLITDRKQQLIEMDLLVKSRFIELFGTYPGNEKGWNTGNIRDVISEVRYGSSRPAVDGGRYPYLRMNNITYGGELDLSDTKRIDIPDNELAKCTVRRGDVLFNRTNSKELVGKTCVYNRDEMMVLAGFVIRVRVNEKVLPEFLSAFLNTDFSKKMLLGMCKTAIGQANINAQELQNIGLYVPPIDLQQEFVDFKTQVDKSKLAVQKGLQELEILKKSLMQQYFG